MFNYNPGINDNTGSIIMQAQQNADNSLQQGMQQVSQGVSQAMQNYGILKARGDAAVSTWEMLKPYLGTTITPEDDKRFYSSNLSTKEAMLNTSNTLFQHALTAAQQRQQISDQTGAAAKLDLFKSTLPTPHDNEPIVGANGMYLLNKRTGVVTPMMSGGSQVPSPPRSNGLMDLLLNGGTSGGGGMNAGGRSAAGQIPPSMGGATVPTSAPIRAGAQFLNPSSAGGNQGAPASSVNGSSLPTITTQDQFNALPRGATYNGPNGIRRKPF